VEEAAGERYCGHTQPVSLRRKELVVNVESSGWLYELTMHKQEISEKLKKRLKTILARCVSASAK